ncbi:MAG: AAA-like domain-containing protein [Anaerolineae bacterium]|nr:AAA-like domain-containing protein [Anaerolineae bacterium]
MKSCFQAGGALPVNYPTYVERQADQDALRVALNGEYLRLIAPRQMGKTSLLKRLAHRLNDMGWRCAYVDLSLLMGFPKSIWYAEFGKILGESLTPGQIPNLSNQIDLRRYLVNMALPYAQGYSYMALCLDEVEGAGKARDIDSQPFSDTFFMTLRNLYNQRDDYKGTLIVALAGAVDPDELVTDPDISPFNVGQEVGLDDFTQPETRNLTNYLSELGVRVDEAIHQAVYDCTNGHPYLTQRLCQILEQAIHRGELTTLTADVVTAMVEQALFKPASPLERDKNLKHVSKMLDHLSLPAARLWSRLRAGETVFHRDASEAVYLELYLTGAVKGQDEELIIRNQIYQKIFADTLSQTNMDMRNTIMQETVCIFISSTWQDLQPEREAVEKALHRMQEAEFSGMEYFGSRPETPKEASLTEVDRSDIYVGLFAHRYGSGITEGEYRRARERGLPCLIYLKDDEVPVKPAHIERDPDKITKLEALKKELKAQHIVSVFTSPDQLATQVATDLHNFLSRKKRTEKPAESGPKYQITIEKAQGLAIGDGATVIQNISGKQDIQSPQAGADQRCADLTENIQETWSLIKLYEEQRRLTSDPKEKRRAEREIANLRQQLAEYEAEARKLGCEQAI